MKSLKKHLFLLTIILLFFILINQGWSEERVESYTGVLLGFRNDSEDTSSYRTLWITNESGKIKVNRRAGILVPDGEDFWLIREKWYEKETYSTLGNTKIRIEYLLAHPLAEPLSLNEKFRNYLNSVEEDWAQVHESTKLMFVGARYACIKQENSYDSGALRREESAVFVREIPDLNRSFIYNDHNDSFDGKKNVSIEKLFGSSATVYIKDYRAMKISETEEELFGKSPTVANLTDEYGWGVTRKSNRWQPQIAKKWFFENGAAQFYTYQLYDLPMDVPKNLVRYPEAGNSLRELKKIVPNAMDAVVSPNQDLWIAFTSGKALIFPGKDSKDPVQVRVSSKESLIMCEWALGEDVSRWDEKLSESLK